MKTNTFGPATNLILQNQDSYRNFTFEQEIPWEIYVFISIAIYFSKYDEYVIFIYIHTYEYTYYVCMYVHVTDE